MQSHRIRSGIKQPATAKNKNPGCSIIVDGQQIVDDSSSNQPFSDHQPLFRGQEETTKPCRGQSRPGYAGKTTIDSRSIELYPLFFLKLLNLICIELTEHTTAQEPPSTEGLELIGVLRISGIDVKSFHDLAYEDYFSNHRIVFVVNVK